MGASLSILSPPSGVVPPAASLVASYPSPRAATPTRSPALPFTADEHRQIAMEVGELRLSMRAGAVTLSHFPAVRSTLVRSALRTPHLTNTDGFRIGNVAAVLKGIEVEDGVEGRVDTVIGMIRAVVGREGEGGDRSADCHGIAEHLLHLFAWAASSDPSSIRLQSSEEVQARIAAVQRAEAEEAKKSVFWRWGVFARVCGEVVRGGVVVLKDVHAMAEGERLRALELLCTRGGGKFLGFIVPLTLDLMVLGGHASGLCSAAAVDVTALGACWAHLLSTGALRAAYDQFSANAEQQVTEEALRLNSFGSLLETEEMVERGGEGGGGAASGRRGRERGSTPDVVRAASVAVETARVCVRGVAAVLGTVIAGVEQNEVELGAAGLVASSALFRGGLDATPIHTPPLPTPPAYLSIHKAWKGDLSEGGGEGGDGGEEEGWGWKIAKRVEVERVKEAREALERLEEQVAALRLHEEAQEPLSSKVKVPTRTSEHWGTSDWSILGLDTPNSSLEESSLLASRCSRFLKTLFQQPDDVGGGGEAGGGGGGGGEGGVGEASARGWAIRLWLFTSICDSIEEQERKKFFKPPNATKAGNLHKHAGADVPLIAAMLRQTGLWKEANDAIRTALGDGSDVPGGVESFEAFTELKDFVSRMPAPSERMLDIANTMYRLRVDIFKTSKKPRESDSGGESRDSRGGGESRGGGGEMGGGASGGGVLASEGSSEADRRRGIRRGLAHATFKFPKRTQYVKSVRDRALLLAQLHESLEVGSTREAVLLSDALKALTYEETEAGEAAQQRNFSFQGTFFRSQLGQAATGRFPHPDSTPNAPILAAIAVYALDGVSLSTSVVESILHRRARRALERARGIRLWTALCAAIKLDSLDVLLAEAFPALRRGLGGTFAYERREVFTQASATEEDSVPHYLDAIQGAPLSNVMHVVRAIAPAIHLSTTCLRHARNMGSFVLLGPVSHSLALSWGSHPSDAMVFWHSDLLASLWKLSSATQRAKNRQEAEDASLAQVRSSARGTGVWSPAAVQAALSRGALSTGELGLHLVTESTFPAAGASPATELVSGVLSSSRSSDGDILPSTIATNFGRSGTMSLLCSLAGKDPVNGGCVAIVPRSPRWEILAEGARHHLPHRPLAGALAASDVAGDLWDLVALSLASLEHQEALRLLSPTSTWAHQRMPDSSALREATSGARLAMRSLLQLIVDEWNEDMRGIANLLVDSASRRREGAPSGGGLRRLTSRGSETVSGQMLEVIFCSKASIGAVLSSVPWIGFTLPRLPLLHDGISLALRAGSGAESSTVDHGGGSDPTTAPDGRSLWGLATRIGASNGLCVLFSLLLHGPRKIVPATCRLLERVLPATPVRIADSAASAAIQTEDPRSALSLIVCGIVSPERATEYASITTLLRVIGTSVAPALGSPADTSPEEDAEAMVPLINVALRPDEDNGGTPGDELAASAAAVALLRFLRQSHRPQALAVDAWPDAVTRRLRGAIQLQDPTGREIPSLAAGGAVLYKAIDNNGRGVEGYEPRRGGLIERIVIGDALAALWVFGGGEDMLRSGAGFRFVDAGDSSSRQTEAEQVLQAVGRDAASAGHGRAPSSLELECASATLALEREWASRDGVVLAGAVGMKEILVLSERDAILDDERARYAAARSAAGRAGVDRDPRRATVKAVKFASQVAAKADASANLSHKLCFSWARAVSNDPLEGAEITAAPSIHPVDAVPLREDALAIGHEAVFVNLSKLIACDSVVLEDGDDIPNRELAARAWRAALRWRATLMLLHYLQNSERVADFVRREETLRAVIAAAVSSTPFPGFAPSHIVREWCEVVSESVIGAALRTEHREGVLAHFRAQRPHAPRAADVADRARRPVAMELSDRLAGRSPRLVFAALAAHDDDVGRAEALLREHADDASASAAIAALAGGGADRQHEEALLEPASCEPPPANSAVTPFPEPVHSAPLREEATPAVGTPIQVRVPDVGEEESADGPAVGSITLRGVIAAPPEGIGDIAGTVWVRTASSDVTWCVPKLWVDGCVHLVGDEAGTHAAMLRLQRRTAAAATVHAARACTVTTLLRWPPEIPCTLRALGEPRRLLTLLQLIQAGALPQDPLLHAICTKVQLLVSLEGREFAWEGLEWKCGTCTVQNKGENEVCTTCGVGHRPVVEADDVLLSKMLVDECSAALVGGAAALSRGEIVHWTSEEDALFSASLDWSVWLLHFLENGALPAERIRDGELHRKQITDALFAVVRTREIGSRRKPLSVLLHLLSAPKFFASRRRVAPDLTPTRRLKDFIVPRLAGVTTPPQPMQWAVELAAAGLAAHKISASPQGALFGYGLPPSLSSDLRSFWDPSSDPSTWDPPLATDVKLPRALLSDPSSHPEQQAIRAVAILRGLLPALVQSASLTARAPRPSRIPDAWVCSAADLASLRCTTDSELAAHHRTLVKFSGQHDLALNEILVSRATISGSTAVSTDASSLSLTPEDFSSFPIFSGYDQEEIRLRAGLLIAMNRVLSWCLQYIDLSGDLGDVSLGAMLRDSPGSIFPDLCIPTIRKILTDTMEACDTLGVTLDRRRAERSDPAPERSQAIVAQLFAHFRTLAMPFWRHEQDGSGRLFGVRFEGEEGIDVGGVFRDTMSNVVDELFHPTPEGKRIALFDLAPGLRRRQAAGGDLPYEVYLPAAGARSATALDLFRFVGKFLGMSLRNRFYLDVKLANFVWKMICGEKITAADVVEIDTSLGYRLLALQNYSGEDDGGGGGGGGEAGGGGEVVRLEEVMHDHGGLPYFVDEGDALIPDGAHVQVSEENRMDYVRLVLERRQRLIEPAVRCLREGLAHSLTPKVLDLCSGPALRLLVCGPDELDVAVLRRHTAYDAPYSESHAVIRRFWTVMEEFDTKTRQAVVRFSWGRSKIPADDDPWDRPFKISQRGGDGSRTAECPIAHTCFFHLELPPYDSVEIMRNKILWAIASTQGAGMLMG